MKPELLALRREILLARCALQRARLGHELRSLQAAASASPLNWGLRAIGSLLGHSAAADPLREPGAARAWIDWAVLALRFVRTLRSHRAR